MPEKLLKVAVFCVAYANYVFQYLYLGLIMRQSILYFLFLNGFMALFSFHLILRIDFSMLVPNLHNNAPAHILPASTKLKTHQ